MNTNPGDKVIEAIELLIELVEELIRYAPDAEQRYLTQRLTRVRILLEKEKTKMGDDWPGTEALKRKLEGKGWKVGDTKEFLKLTEKEIEIIKRKEKNDI